MLLSKNVLPSSVMVDGKNYEIHTDSCYWFRFAELLQDKKALYTDFDFIYVKKIPHNRIKGFEALFNFYHEEKKIPKKSEEKSTVKALDYTLDADLIYSALLEQYHIDLFDKPIHWHKVRAMLEGLHSTRLNDIIGYRLYKTPGKSDSYDKQMCKMRDIWQIETEEEKATEVRNYFNSLLRQ